MATKSKANSNSNNAAQQVQQAAQQVQQAGQQAGQQVRCAVCNKPMRAGSSSTCGALCASRLAAGATVQVCATVKQALSVSAVPAGYISLTGKANPICKANYVPISRLVKCTGGDRVMLPLAHAICLPVYVQGVRYIHGWLVTKAGLQAMLTGNFSAAPALTAQQQAWYAYWQQAVKCALAGSKMPAQPKIS